MALIIKTPNAVQGSGFSNYKDPLIPIGGGINYLFDFASALSWQKQANPTSGDPVYDIVSGSMGGISHVGGQTLTWAGNGIDFSAITTKEAVITAPAGVLQSIADAANDYFLVSFYIKLPTLANWNTAASLFAIFCATTESGGYTAASVNDLLTIAMANNPTIAARRQTNGATADALTASPALHYGLITQVAFWRNASGQGLRLRSSGGTTLTTAAVGSNNAGNFGAKIPRWGVCNSFTVLGSPAGSDNFRIYRGWIEDLTVSGRTPVTVLDEDYARTIARGVFS